MSEGSRVPGKTVPQLHRAVEALKRQALREERSPVQQLAELDSRPGKSAKERKRLTHE